ncbi:MGH1-like glycoside hydrolase domain-containing protein [Maribacter sp. 2304DJ31-5]|uniref:MGH1-like glycoside hydrolase domain-containing protein n=1 Tax=Maribacter sp. 2304DJ31-5 TaxID=3386273 RepID=UPI0039BC2539
MKNYSCGLLQKSLLSFALLYILGTVYSCSVAIPDYDSELVRLRKVAKKTLSEDVKEFNDYKERPKSDGAYNSSNNSAFLQENIPMFLSSNEDFTEVYNYRWWMISKHLRPWKDPSTNKDIWVITEFFGWPGHASISGAIPCPAGHQFYDVRWLKDPTYLRSYAEFYLSGYASKNNQRENPAFHSHISRPESHHFSSWMVDATEAFLKVHPNKTWRNKMLPYMEAHQKVWDSKFMVNEYGSKTDGLYKVLDLYDGMEFTISATMPLIASDGPYAFYTEEKWRDYYLGWGTINDLRSSKLVANQDAFANAYPLLYLVRPSINSYYYGNLKSLGNLYALKAGETDNQDAKNKSEMYHQKAHSLQARTLNTLWNEEDQFFYSYTAADNNYGVKDQESRVRESVGYTPWYFNMIPKSSKKYDAAWKMFYSKKGFYNKKGMTTAEQQSPYYDEQAYAWNGRGWPFQNSIVNKAYANYLKNYKDDDVTKADKELLYDYVQKLVDMHGEKRNIGEWYIPSNGEQFGGVQDYFHSTFPDMLIEDLLGFTSSHKDSFSIQPLLPEDKWDYFYLGNIRYHNCDIDIIWKKDWDPKTKGEQSKLCIWVNGKLMASNDSLNERVIVGLPETKNR